MSKRQLDELTTAQVLCQLSYVGSPIIARQGDAVVEWRDDSIYQETCERLLFDPLPVVEGNEEHQVVAVDPGWFLSFDDVDSRTIQDPGAPA